MPPDPPRNMAFGPHKMWTPTFKILAKSLLLTHVKCKQRNASTIAILSVFPMPCESVSLQKSYYVAGFITFQSFPNFLNPSESCREKAVFIQHPKTSLHSKFHQTALKLTLKGLDYTQIGTLRERVSLIFDSEKF